MMMRMVESGAEGELIHEVTSIADEFHAGESQSCITQDEPEARSCL